MEIKEFMERIRQIKGVSEVERYSLVNNYGVAFKKYGYKFDIRFWANCYGVALNYWELMVSKEYYDKVKEIKVRRIGWNLSELLPSVENL